MSRDPLMFASACCPHLLATRVRHCMQQFFDKKPVDQWNRGNPTSDEHAAGIVAQIRHNAAQCHPLQRLRQTSSIGSAAGLCTCGNASSQVDIIGL